MLLEALRACPCIDASLAMVKLTHTTTTPSPTITGQASTFQREVVPRLPPTSPTGVNFPAEHITTYPLPAGRMGKTRVMSSGSGILVSGQRGERVPLTCGCGLSIVSRNVSTCKYTHCTFLSWSWLLMVKSSGLLGSWLKEYYKESTILSAV